MPSLSSSRSILKSLAVTALLVAGAAPLAGRAGNISSTDQARAWAALSRMKPMEVMHMIDADKKGYVSREEFMQFQQLFFDRMDRDHDGKVDAQEWMGKSAGSSAGK
jgi:Ca2+-binding EF-hand superfamily protein